MYNGLIDKKYIKQTSLEIFTIGYDCFCLFYHSGIRDTLSSATTFVCCTL